MAGQVTSVDLPTTQSVGPGGGNGDAFVAKFDPSGALLYNTRLGGSDLDSPGGIAADHGGSTYVTGSTTSTNFPTRGAFQERLFPTGDQTGCVVCADAFVTKLDPSGGLDYSSYLGGEADDSGGTYLSVGSGIATDSSGNAYVTG